MTLTNYMPLPTFRVSVTHSGTTSNYEKDLFTYINVRRLENGIDQAQLTFSDTQSKYYDTNITKGDTVVVRVKDANDSTAWASVTPMFSGRILLVRPSLGHEGELTLAQADGSGYGLMNMLVADEYGTQSNNPTLDTIKTIVEDDNEGVIDEYVNDYLNTGTTAGHAYTTEVEAIAGSIPYMEFPYKPAYKVLDDLCDIVTALKAGAAGPHWIVDTSSRVLIATVGSHGAPASTYWPTWLNSTTDNTLEQGVDFTDFNFETLDKEANYVLYYGKMMKPVHDVWTENNSGSWGPLNVSSILSDEAVEFVVPHLSGHSIECHNNAVAALSGMYYPTLQNLGLDLTKFGGERNPVELCFYGRIEYNGAPSAVYVRLWTGAGAYFQYNIFPAIDLGGAPATTKFVHFRLPCGDFFPVEKYPGFSNWTTTGAALWTSINAIEFEQNTTAMSSMKLYIDDLRFEGSVIRGAKQAAAFTTTAPCKMALVTDNIGKDDTGKTGTPGATDLGTVALMAKAEYYRLSSTPTVGYVSTPMIKDALPGQLIHIHAKKTATGTFTINANMRILKLVHNLSVSGATTTFELTTDVINGRARSRFGDINKVLQSARPEFQDRQASSIKLSDIDITQPVLTESY